MKFAELIDSATNSSSRYTTFLNPVSYLIFRDQWHKLNGFNIQFDSWLLAFLVQSFYGVSTRRQSFDLSSLGMQVLEEAARLNKSVYLIGTDHAKIHRCADNLMALFPRLNIVGFEHGYLAESEFGSAVRRIINASADIVIVGMGSGKQEKFVSTLMNYPLAVSAYTCGGFFHQTAARPNYYPWFIRKTVLRVIFRMMMERGHWKRIIFLYPKFLYLFVSDYYSYLKKKSR